MDKLKISENGHYLENAVTGEPFMWMGIVPWKMPQLASREDVDFFISEIKKPEHEYNVIFAVIIMSQRSDTLNPENAYGDRAFSGGSVPDFNRPKIVSGGTPDNPTDFWDHMDYIVRECEANDIYLVLVPQWSNMYVNDAWGRGIDTMDASTARGYGEFLGDRYKNEKHIIWMLGGDGGDPNEEGTKSIYRAQAEGLLKGYTGCTSCPAWNEPDPLWSRLMMTYHGHIEKYISNRVSQLWDLEDDVWIDIDGCYNGTARRGDWYGIITDGYNLPYHKPMIEVEGQGFWTEDNINWPPNFGGTKSFPYMHYIFGGAGPSNLDQLWDFEPGWEEILTLPERNWVGYMTDFMYNLWYKLVPDNGLVLSDPGTMWGEIVAAHSVDNDFILVSFSEESSGSAKIDLSPISDYSAVRSTWLNTSTGGTQDAGNYDSSESPWFTAPANWSGAVLKIEGITLDPCVGVDCPDICIGKDRWSQKCENGVCVDDQLIEINSSSCVSDPCAGVNCPDICIGKDRWSQKCEDGVCVDDQLIEINSSSCVSDPCADVDCPNICICNDIWSQKCDPTTGLCVPYQLLIKDATDCMNKVPTDESSIQKYLIIGGLGLAGFAMLLMSRNKK